MTRIAIIGAGLSGLTLAHRLGDKAEVVVFDKGRGFGGRMATRYTDRFAFDHGAQFFTALTEPFQAFLQPLIEAGVVARWDARFAEYTADAPVKLWNWDAERPHHVGVPKMNTMAKHLAGPLTVHRSIRVAPLTERAGDGWRLETEKGEELGAFDWVISTAPPVQTAALLPDSFAHRAQVTDTKMLGCFAMMLGLDSPPDIPFDAAHIGDADISWASLNSAKPGRESEPSVVVHATNAWAEAHMEDDPDAVLEHMLAEFIRVTEPGEGFAASIAHRGLHRWRYANIPKQDGAPALLDAENRLAACGDWCIQGRVEAAFTSAMALAEDMRAVL